MRSSFLAPRVEANGASIPAIGFGTWQLTGGACQRAVENALEVGYRHIDTAAMYGNEGAVGSALRGSGLCRESFFVTTKVWRDNLRSSPLLHSLRQSTDNLGLDYVDLLLVHWPNEDVPLPETIASLALARQSGLTRHVGVSNFPVALLNAAVRAARAEGIQLATNQCEYHPGLSQSSLLAACRANGVAFTAYSPLGQGQYLSHPLVLSLCNKYGRTPAQVVLRWLVQQEGVVAIPKTSNRQRLTENLGIFDFSLDASDMTAITKMGGGARITDPDFSPMWDT
jgi:diketogulonate reductase-like aldo/keto reductase